MRKFNVGDVVCGTYAIHQRWDCEFTAEVVGYNTNNPSDLRVTFKSWVSSNPNNQWRYMDTNQVFSYPSTFFQLLKEHTYAENLFFGD